MKWTMLAAVLLSTSSLWSSPPNTLVVEEEVSLVTKENVGQNKTETLARIPEGQRADFEGIFVAKEENSTGTPIPQRRTLYANLQTGQIRVEIKDLRDLPAIIKRLKLPSWQVENLDTSRTYIIESRGAKKMLSISTAADGSKRFTWLPISARMTSMSRWLLRVGIIPDGAHAERNQSGMPTRLESRVSGDLRNEIVMENHVTQGERVLPQKIVEKTFYPSGEQWSTESNVIRVEVDKPIPEDKFSIPKNVEINDPMELNKRQP